VLDILNANGQSVRRLVDEPKDAGVHQITWDGTNHQGSLVASGMYFYRLLADGQEASRKMLLLK
jgi:flagellar hook assembly protein FlgD